VLALDRSTADKLFWLGDFDPTTPERRAIPDPWGKPQDEFVAAFTRIERCIGGIRKNLRH
jgi:protein-tyrosine-phosphatase